MSGKKYYVNCAGYLCDKYLSNTLSIFECADLLNKYEQWISLTDDQLKCIQLLIDDKIKQQDDNSECKKILQEIISDYNDWMLNHKRNDKDEIIEMSVDEIVEKRNLIQKAKHWVFVDVDTQRGCYNCKHNCGSICEELICGVHDWLLGVSDCGLVYWVLRE